MQNENDECRIVVFPLEMIFNPSAKRTQSFCIFHFAFCIPKKVEIHYER